MTSSTYNVAILLFDGVEILDFCGPYEVFSVANRELNRTAFRVHTVATSESIKTQGELTVCRHFSLGDSPRTDILLVPGGAGVLDQLENQKIIDWVSTKSAEAELTTSVCTGAILLAVCGLLNGREATTHHHCFEQLRNFAPDTTIKEDCRFVDTGDIITSAGISAGIDMCLHIVSRLHNQDLADSIAKRMEYHTSRCQTES